MNLKVNKIYKPLFTSSPRYYILMGGRATGRSHTASQFILSKLLSSSYARIAIMRFILGDIRNSIFQEMKDRIEEAQLEDSIEIKDSSLTIQYGKNKINGIGFRKSSSDQRSKLKSLASYNIVVIEEADEVCEDDFQQLDDSLRTIKSNITIILLLNCPHKKHWIIRRWFNLTSSSVDGYYKAELKKTAKDTIFIGGTYLDNKKNLNQKTIDNYENYKNTNPDHYYNMIMGLISEGERGRIFKNWKIISDSEYEALPYPEDYGLDFGFTCLSGDTIIETSSGKKRLDKVKVGDKVFTRNGYKKVTWSGSRGFKKVYSVNFGLGKRIIATGNHRIYTINGWKEVDKLLNEETICELKKPLREEYIIDTQTENTLIISISKKMERVGFYIGIFTRKVLEKFLLVFQFIISIKIHSIIKQKILSLYLFQIILKFITKMLLVRLPWKQWMILDQGSDIRKKTGSKEERKGLKQLRKGLKIVLSVVKILYLPMFIKNFVVQIVERDLIQEIVKKNICAKIAVKNLYHHHITKETHVLVNVRVSLQQQKEKEEVFDLTVEDCHEYFANGVLVHNCDPASLTAIKEHNDKIYCRELIYETGLINKRLSEKMEKLGVDKNKIIWADSAEPKSIEELRQYGWDIRPAPKGADSIRMGVNLLLSKDVSYTESSINLDTEVKQYKWALDRNKEPTNEPIDEFNHSIDGIRYNQIAKFKQDYIGFG